MPIPVARTLIFPFKTQLLRRCAEQQLGMHSNHFAVCVGPHVCGQDSCHSGLERDGGGESVEDDPDGVVLGLFHNLVDQLGDLHNDPRGSKFDDLQLMGPRLETHLRTA